MCVLIAGREIGAGEPSEGECSSIGAASELFTDRCNPTVLDCLPQIINKPRMVLEYLLPVAVLVFDYMFATGVWFSVIWAMNPILFQLLFPISE